MFYLQGHILLPGEDTELFGEKMVNFILTDNITTSSLKSKPLIIMTHHE